MDLIILDSRDGGRRRFTLASKALTFGSSVESEVVLRAAEIAPAHGRFERTSGGVRLVVDAAARDVEVNGASARDLVLRPGDVVKVGPYQISFSAAKSTSAEPTTKAANAANAPASSPPRPRPQPSAANAPRAGASASHPPRHSSAALAGVHPPERAGIRARATRLSTSGGPNKEAMITVAVIVGILVIGVGAFFMHSGGAWSHMAASDQPEKIFEVRELIGKCEYAAASQRLDQLLAQAKASTDRNRLLDVKDEIESARVRYAAAEKELDELRKRAGGLKSWELKDQVQHFQNTHRDMARLIEQAQRLVTGGQPAEDAPSELDDTGPASRSAGFESRPKKGGN